MGTDTGIQERQSWANTGRGWSEASTSQGTPKNAATTRSQERDKEKLSFTGYRKSMALPTSSFQISGLRTMERVSFCLLKSPGLW